jgi:DNA-binding response OmpR family regulator
MTEKSKKKILVVEDDLLMSNIVANKLKLSGFEVVAASDGQAAVDNLAKGQFDLVLLDLTMPWFDGFHVLEEMKKANVKTPVIIMSNLAGQDDINKAKALGAVNYLVKTSVTPDDIVKEVNNSLA